VHSAFSVSKWLGVVLFFAAFQAWAADTWSGPAFTAEVGTLRTFGETVKTAKHAEATVFLNDVNFNFDEAGNLVETRHLIYRIESQDGVQNWSETSGQWDAWHQAKPDIKARVITPDGAVHWLDPRTLSDIPVHQGEPDTYSDERKYGGPLPALAPGAIVEEQVIIRDTAPLFAGGYSQRWRLAWSVPVNHTHFVISHPSSVPLRYQVHLLPDARISKSNQNGSETITIEQGPLPAYVEEVSHVPPDVMLYPEIEFSTGASWHQVASEYARLSDNKLRLSDVESIVTKLNIKAGDRNESVRRIVAALHKTVRYTGVEFGESNLVPQFPSETLNRRYGDCKDKASLLVAMLRSAGIPAVLALLDTGPGRDISSELPGIGLFDHAIVYIPSSPSEPELWIDATAQFSQVGTLPWMDYGRLALIISDKTESLKQIPGITSAQDVHHETREFTLSEYGPAKIVETDDEIGPEDADYREYYAGDSKKVKEESVKYVKDAYLADSLTSLDHGDLLDLEKPGSIKFVTQGKRGNTELTAAVVAIRVESLFDTLPKYFKFKEEEQTANSNDDAPRPRTADWWITPFTTEWKYKITAPIGFKLRALPLDKNETIGTLSFSQKYSTNPQGSEVEALLRVENTTSRLTVQQAKDLRDAVIKERNADPIFITFDHTGHSLISAGKIKEGLAIYRQIAAQHPKEALHKVQLAQALLTAGLGEEARTVAQEAAALEPNSALAFSTLGAVLKHDLIGRLEKKGMDYGGAVAAYRKALALDPKDKETRANLALLLEYDADGTRYSEKANLKEAVTQLHELKKVDEEYSRSYDDNVLYDLWYAHDYKGVLDYAATLPTSEVRKGLTLAAIALQEGADAALKRSLEITTDNQERSKALVTAGAVLVRVRKYAEGAAMFIEGARGQNNESQIMRSATIYAKTKPYEDFKIDPSNPRGVVQDLFGKMLSGKLTLDEFKLLSYHSEQNSDLLDQKQFQQTMSTLRSQLSALGLPLVTIADMAVSNMHYTVDGDDSTGYKVIIESPGAPAQDIYVVRDGSGYKIAGFSVSGSTVPDELASLALEGVEKNNLAAARKWLDRARDKVHMGGGDDPLAGQPFPYFWTKGQDGDISAIHTAALVLLRSKDVKGLYLTALNEARANAKTDIDRARLTMVLAYAYAAQERWSEMLPLAEELARSFPTSLRAFDLVVMAYTRVGRLDDWDRLVQARMQAHRDEPAYIRSSAQLAAYRGKFSKSREITKTLIDQGQATESDLNLYAWYALLLPSPIEAETIDVAVRANDLSKDANFAILHTLACVYAQDGKTGQARELLLKAIDVLHLEEPNPEVWFGLALIAEQYAEFDAARKMYGRVEKPKFDYPGTSYVLAQYHLDALTKTANASVKNAGQ
jgi:tetratricopeptide (TPR) repeat protein